MPLRQHQKQLMFVSIFEERELLLCDWFTAMSPYPKQVVTLPLLDVLPAIGNIFSRSTHGAFGSCPTCEIKRQNSAASIDSDDDPLHRLTLASTVRCGSAHGV